MKTLRRVMEAGGKVAVMLLRRSTNMQDKSIVDQREYVLNWAGLNGYSVIGEYVDDAISGDDHEHREGFERLLQDVKNRSRAWNCILSYDRARYTRADIYEAATYADQILKAGADVVYCCEGKSLSTDHEIVWAVETFQKHEVLKQTSRDTLRGMLALARKGLWCGGPIPYGFDAEIVDKLTGKAVRRIRLIRRMRTHPDGTREAAIHHILDTEGKFVREVRSSVESALPLKSEAEVTRLASGDPARVNAVRDIFQSMADRGMGFKAVARALNGRGISPPGGHGLWRTSAVKAILHNPIYRGILEWNSRTEAKYNFIQNGTMVPKPRSAKSQVLLHDERDRIQIATPELALVTPELWHRAHAARAQRADQHYCEKQRLQTHSNLGGKLICDHCGGKMYGHTSTKTKMVGGKPQSYVRDFYVCSTYLNSGADQCGYNRVPGRGLERFILSKIRESMPDLAGSLGLRQKIKAKLEAMFGRPKNTPAAGLRKRLAELEDRVTILERLDGRDRAKIGQEAAYHEAKEEVARISRQLRADRGDVGPAINIEAATTEVVDCLTNLENFDQLPAATQKSFFGRFVDKVVLHFRKEARGKRVVSVLERGLLQLLPLHSGLLFRPGYSGGGI